MDLAAAILTPGLADFVRARGGRLTIAVRPYLIG
jgi:hypothetical protein